MKPYIVKDIDTGAVYAFEATDAHAALIAWQKYAEAEGIDDDGADPVELPKLGSIPEKVIDGE